MTIKAFRISGPRFWAQDPTTGGPLAFGKLYTYEPGTTTPKLTYTDESGEVANSNPVVLNAAGYASVHMKGAYKLVLADANDVVIYSADAVSQPVSLGDIDLTALDVGSMLYWDGTTFIAGNIAQIRTLIGSDNPAVVSLANIADTPNTLPYVAAPDTFGVMQFLPFVQEIIAADDISTLRTKIGPRLKQLEDLTLAEGDIFYVTASGALAKLTKGAPQTVLRQNSALTAPEWTQPQRKFLASGSVGAPAANLALALASYTSLGYTQFELEVDDILPATDGANLNMVISTDGGANYLSTLYGYAVSSLDVVTNRDAGAAASFRMWTSQGDAAGEIGQLRLRFDINASRFWYEHRGEMVNSAGNFETIIGGGLHKTGNVNAVRLQYSAGNIASAGAYRLFGIKKVA